jgi:hypothetical protein
VNIQKYIQETVPGEEIMLADGLDEAFIGIGRTFTTPLAAVYDSDKVIKILMTRDVMTYEEAWEFFEFNIAGAYVGESTPIFISVMKKTNNKRKGAKK